MTYELQNTSRANLSSIWLHKQEALIASLQLQPLVVLLRPQKDDLNFHSDTSPLKDLIERLQAQGVKHIEVAWSSHPSWTSLMQDLREHFPMISLGAASITSSIALEAVKEIDLDYAMSPFWNIELQKEAQIMQQMLIPGVFSPTEINEACSFGCRLIKIFPASILGRDYIHRIKASIDSLPFVIAAGGLTVKDLHPWLKEGYNAVVIGRELLKNKDSIPALKEWISKRRED